MNAKALAKSANAWIAILKCNFATGRLIERLSDRRDVSDIKGIVYKRANRVISTGRKDLIEDIDHLPMPAYDLIPIERYGSFSRMSRTGSGRFMSLFSSRGCPYRCIYCHNIFGKVFRFRNAESFFKEIKHLHDTYQIRDFEILDGIFNLDRNRLIDFCNRIINSGMKIALAFPNGMRGDLLDGQQLSKLRQAGAIFIASRSKPDRHVCKSSSKGIFSWRK
jgi:anaerobic magnesium-protoporphyrin IX monomethyl ester cyclase